HKIMDTIPNLPLGFYKLLMILELIEQKPEILVIDEIENSLHEKMIEYIIDAITVRGIKTIISTHSPMVVDLVDLKNILIVKMVNNQTKVERITNPKQKSESLIKEGITPSESLLYGGIDH
ncbi:AAA family ATPase, partial [Ferroplasma acidiphilum]